MDKVKVDEPREAPPDWAKPAQTRLIDATNRQLSFITGLVAERDLTQLNQEQQDFLKKPEIRLTKQQASRLIETLLKLPKKPKPTTVTDGIETSVDLSGLPAGRYAIENELGEGPELRFYQCWESPDKKTKRLYVMFGPSEGHLPYKAQVAIADAIVKRGVRECAIKFGLEIGSCSNCGRRLTNNISRALGIGPICGGRMFGKEDFAIHVRDKRNDLLAEGIDPDEEVE